MLSSHILGTFFALLAAGLIGAADFTGGVVTRRIHPYQVLLMASAASVLLMGALTLIVGEKLPVGRDVLFAGLAGLSGALAIITIYRALALGNAALAAPVAGVVGAIMPVVFSILSAQYPTLLQMIGFGVALPGLALVSISPNGKQSISRQGLVLSVVSGLGAGGFLILFGQVQSQSVFALAMTSKSATLVAALTLLCIRRIPFPNPLRYSLALLSGGIDGFGNVFYLLAGQFTRMDIAAVITSLYPASTVMLSCLVFKEKVSAVQWIGVVLCLVAIGLIAA